MSLFHRRTRSVSASSRPNNTYASDVAHSAAAQAFLANRASNANLSNAAAAAALRTMSPGPTQVGQIQTRRMLQRQNSGSSTGSVQRAQSAPRGRGYPLERQNSGGSMTERTFRTPSPHGSGRNGPPKPPPVPSVPREYHDVPPIPKRSHRRTASMDPQPARVISPPPTHPAGRGISLDRGANPQPQQYKANRVTSLQNLTQLQQPRTKAPRVTSLQDLNQLQRIDSNGSANFSYPGRSRPMSPSPSPTYNQKATVPNAAISAAASASVRREVTKAAEQPVKKKKKKKLVRGAAEGSHLLQGGMGSKPMVAPVDARMPAVTQILDSQTYSQPLPVVKKKKKKVVGTGEAQQIPPGRPMSPQGGSDSDSTPEKRARRAARASGQLTKQPSVVREDWEGEQGTGPQIKQEAYERASQDLSPTSSPNAVLPGKKLTGANVSRKIDEMGALETQRNYNTLTMAPPLSQPPDKSLLRVSENDAPTNRGPSLSPSRSMRFSDRLASDLTAGRKHDPLPRSVSPAKSALKHHSPSPTDPRFPGRYIHSHTASEASDNASNVSADVLVPPGRKKKSARVSFDSEPEVVGTAAPVEETETPVLASPQNKEAGKRGWFGFSKSKAPILGTIAAEDEMEEVMKPRPALPSFGSVRKGGRLNENTVSVPSYNPASTPTRNLPKQTSSTVSSTASESSGSQIPTMDTSVSSDHAIGGILAHGAAQFKVRDQNEPLPPEVTSVEGTGYVSDDDSVTGHERTSDTHKEAVHMAPLEIPLSTVAAGKDLELVPTISVQPATPGIDQDEPKNPDQWLVDVPGGFPVSTEALAHITTPELESTTPAGLGIAEPKPLDMANTIKMYDLPLTTPQRQPRDRAQDDVSDGDSIYSDAAEDVSEHGDGFGSINAIVESPIIVPTHNQVTPSYDQVTTPPESPLVAKFIPSESRPGVPQRTTSWDQAQAHWSGIAEQYRQGISQPSGLSEDEERTIKSATARAPVSVPISAPAAVQAYAEKKPSIRKKNAAVGSQSPSMTDSSRKMPQSSPYPSLGSGREIQPVPPPPPFRSSMRPQAQPEWPHFRSSMRAQPELEDSHFRGSMRQRPKSMQGALARPASPPQAMRRPVSQGTPAVQNQPKQRAALQKKYIPPGAVPYGAGTAAALKAARPTQNAQYPPPVPKKALQRTLSNDSDSSSSFKKKKHQRGKSSQDSYTMRRSMRSSAESQPPVPAGRGGIRSLSPPRTRRPMSPVFGQKTMRSSMRSSAEYSAPTMRPEPRQKRSSSLFGRSKNKSPPPAAPMPLTKQLRSRFAGDSDSDDDRPKVFRSRFEDSSDDEAGPAKLRPVRGIPRRNNDGDSTDLDDSSADEGRGKQVKSNPSPIKAHVNQGSHFASGSSELPASPASTTKKPGFFGRFKSKKNKDENAKSRLGGTIAERDATLEHNLPVIEAAKMENNISTPRKKEADDKTRASRLGFSTIAERDAVLEQTRLKLEEARSEQTSVANGVRRPAPERIMSDSWPLPPKIPGLDEDRPNTSDGVAYASENDPGLTPALRQESPGVTPVYGRSGKKKRFPMLRKAFGLVD